MIPSGLYSYHDSAGNPHITNNEELVFAGNWLSNIKYRASLKQVVSFYNRLFICVTDVSGSPPLPAQTPVFWSPLTLVNSIASLGGDSAVALAAANQAQVVAAGAQTTANLALAGTGVVQVQATEDVPAFYPITLNGKKVDSSNLAHYGHLAGLTAAAVSSGFLVSIQRGGLMTNPGWAWSPLASVFISSGGLNASPPVAGWTQIIGVAQNDTTLLLTLGAPILL